jgi:hypothetical protein
MKNARLRRCSSAEALNAALLRLALHPAVRLASEHFLIAKNL